MQNTQPTETYRHPVYMCERILRYNRKDGRHVVIVHRPAGEDLYPTGYWFDDIDEARNRWRTIRANWQAEGYERVA